MHATVVGSLIAGALVLAPSSPSSLAADPLLDYATVVAADNPAAYWPMGDAPPDVPRGGTRPSTVTTVEDLAGTRDGQAKAGVYPGVWGAIEDDPNTAMYFDGKSNGHVTLGTGSSGSVLHVDDVSVEAWVKSHRPTCSQIGGDAPPDCNATIYDVGGEGGYALRVGPGSVTAEVVLPPPDVDSGPQQYTARATDVDVYDGLWHHLVMTKNGTGLGLFVDGIVRDVDNELPSSDIHYEDFAEPGNNPVRIGSRAEGSNHFRGRIDEVAVYTATPLQQAQVTAHYTAAGRGYFDRFFDELQGADMETVEYLADPVNSASGSLTEAVTDLDFPDAVHGLDWGRTYNSIDTAVGALGVGWSTTLGASITELPSEVVELKTPESRVVRFFPSSDGGYVRPREFEGDLALEADNSFVVTMFDGTSLEFDTADRLQALVNWDGQRVDLTYSGGRLATATSTTGHSLSFTYHATTGRLTGVAADDGRTVGYGYDADGDLAAVTDAAGGITTYATDATGLITSIRDPEDKLVVAVDSYDTERRVTAERDALGDVTTLAYNGTTGVTTMTDVAGGASASYTHDRLGRMTAMTDPYGRAFSRKVDIEGDVTEMTDRLGRIVTQHFDGNGNLLSRTEPGDVTRGYAYTADNRLETFFDAEEGATTLTYDGNERIPSTVEDPSGGDTVAVVENGLVMSVTDPDGVTTTYGYDAARNRTSVTDELGHATTYTYDGAGRVLTERSHLGNTTTYTYDGAGRVLTETDPTGAVTTYTYDDAGRVLTVTDPTGAVTTTTYDVKGRRATEADPNGGVTTYAYDGADRVTSTTRPGGATTTYTYDVLGRLETETDPTGVTMTHTYDADGRLTTTTDEAGGQTTRTVDVRGLVTAETDQIGRTTTTTYDDLGHKLSETNHAGDTTSYTYDDAGRLLTTEDPRGGVETRTYTPGGRLLTLQDQNGHMTTYHYDAAGNVEHVDDPVRGSTQVAYDADGRVTSETTPGGLTTGYTYDAAGRVLSVTDPAGGVTQRTYTARGELETTTDPTLGEREYQYDPVGNLVESVEPNAGHTTYTYDGRGNRLTRTDAKAGVERFTYDLADRLLTEKDQLDRVTTYAYDNVGRVASVVDPSGRSETRTYDLAGQVTRLAYGDGTAVDYTYDAAGRIATVSDPSGPITYAYDRSGNVTGVDGPGGPLSYAYDPAGNRTVMSRAGGTTVNYAYDAAGRMTQLSLPRVEAPSYSATVVADGPEGYWRLGESSGTSAADASGTANSGTYVGAVALGKTGALSRDTQRSVGLSGSAQYVTANGVSNDVDGSGGYTIEAWARPTNTGLTVVAMFNTSTGGNRAGVFWSGSEGKFTFLTDATGHVASSSTFSRDAWHHVVATVAGDGAGVLYVDGREEATFSTSEQIAATDKFSIGQEWDNASASNFFGGDIDEAAVYAGPLAADDVEGHFLAGASRYARGVADDAPAGHWRLGEFSGTAAADMSGEANPGTVVGGGAWSGVGALSGNSDASIGLDGTADYIAANAVSADVAGGAGYTIEAWARPTDTSSTVVAMFNTSTGGNRAGIFWVGTQGKFTFFADDTNHVATSRTFSRDAWHHVVASVADDGAGVLYVDGREEATFSTGQQVAATDKFSIGQEWDTATASNFFGGNVDEVAVYPDALSEDDVARHFAIGAGEQQQQMLEGDPTGYWPLGDSRNAVAVDATGASPASVLGAPSRSQAGALSHEADFATFLDGTDDYLRADTAATTMASAPSMTMEAWVKPDDTTVGAVAGFNSSTGGHGNQIFWSQTSGKFSYFDATTSWVGSTGTFSADQWHHVAVTIDTAANGNQGRLFVDGTQQATFTTAVRPAAGGRFSIGQDWDSATATDLFRGRLDEVAVYRRALTPEEIADHHRAGSVTVSYAYDADDHLVAEDQRHLRRSWSYDDGRVAVFTDDRAGAPAATTTLTHDAAGRIESATTAGATTTYDYDPAGQLLSEVRGAPGGADDGAYTYDAVGNRLSVAQGGVSNTFSYDAANQLVVDDAASYGHDQAGRLTSETPLGSPGTPSAALAYDGRGKLVTTTRPSLGGTSEVEGRAYDPQGRLARVDRSGTAVAEPSSWDLTWDPTGGVPQLVALSDGLETVELVNGPTRALIVDPWGARGAAQDVHGNAVATPLTSDWVQPGEVNAFGAGSVFGTTLETPQLGYRGELQVGSLVHLRARDYDPATGRFTTTDPVDGVAGDTVETNAYAYAANDPVNLADPLGLFVVADFEFWLIAYPQEGGWRQAVADFAGAVLEWATYGNAEEILDALGQGGKINTSSRYFAWGIAAGIAVDVVTGIGTLRALGRGAMHLAPKLRAAATAMRGVLDDLPAATRRALDGASDILKGRRAQSGAARRAAGAACRSHSFDGATPVLLANGERKAISEVRVGDDVLATDPETGETGAREVIATLPHTDQLLTLRTSAGEIVTTEDHKYWNRTDGEWQESQHLDPGDELLTADGDRVTVEGLDWSTVDTNAAYDLTVQEFHSFYVGVGGEAVLVHNCIGIPSVTDAKLKNYVAQLYKHANKPGTVGNGTTMDAIRDEIAAGGGPHIQKGEEIVRGLNRWLGRKRNASHHDRLVAKSLYDELVDALGYIP